MGPVITVAGLKGGVGKTCTAVALSSAAAVEGATLLVDADPNGSAVRWHRRGDDPLSFSCVAIQSAPMAMQKQEWSTVVVDTAGGSKDEQSEYANGSSMVICPVSARRQQPRAGVGSGGVDQAHRSATRGAADHVR